MFNDVWKFFAGIAAFVIAVLYKNNKSLKRDKTFLKREALEMKKKLEISEESLNVTQKHRNKSIDGNIARMRDGKL